MSRPFPASQPIREATGEEGAELPVTKPTGACSPVPFAFSSRVPSIASAVRRHGEEATPALSPSPPGCLRGHLRGEGTVRKRPQPSRLLIPGAFYCIRGEKARCVNCAGITMDEFLLKQTEEAFDAVLRVNLKGTFLVTQAVARALVESGNASGGSIINMGSIVGKVGNLGQVNYAASKAGVEAISKTAAKELARYGIRCNTVLPGFIRSPMTDKVPQKVLDKFAGMVPLGRLGDPEDVADVCAFLASEDSCYITGAASRSQPEVTP
ncbi:(3R)-3-hydroxyacyl-CoA dehydrogenase [Sceloporus undulatus]|uniref:(3R)-3-hydroxyacyl-CoA dehydrogenase n=1 Tax=Sceloporus undulatus TaxID=8520 RepID=UPI001C4D79B4|nr:(3R)-3-hydroxyacyl-CoA dehydrogenase [Sceloporus undulatus]